MHKGMQMKFCGLEGEGTVTFYSSISASLSLGKTQSYTSKVEKKYSGT